MRNVHAVFGRLGDFRIAELGHVHGDEIGAEQFELLESCPWPFAAGDNRAFDLMRSFVHMHERSEEHTSELQSLMRISYAVFCLQKKKHPLTTSTPLSPPT